jgi:chromosome segregation ATPase
MTDALMGFTLGFAVVLTVTVLWKAIGAVREWYGSIEDELGRLEVGWDSVQVSIEDHTQQLMRLAERIENSGAGAADAALAQLAARVSKIEKALAEQDLTILDTAERVAHKLQDRQRKRNGARELEEEAEDVPTDPNLLLARARQFYGAAARDEGQMQLDGIAQ